MNDDEHIDNEDDSGFWTPSPKMQILLIGAGLFAFNALLIVIWAIVFAKDF